MAVRRKIVHKVAEPEAEFPVMPHKTVTDRKNFWERVGPYMLVALVVGSFALGSLWSKVQCLEKTSANAKNTTDTTTQQPQQPQRPVVTLDMVKSLWSRELVKFGDASAKNLFVDVSDPSCPYCHIAAGKNPELNRQDERFKLVADGGVYVAPVAEMKKLLDKGQAAYVYIYQNGHSNGEVAARALYCAFEKGKYWEAHDKLMSSEGYELINNVVKNDKTKAGEMANFLEGVVDAGFMKDCLEGAKYDQRLIDDQKLAMALGAGSTPSFFVNEKYFEGAYGWKDMESALN